MVDYRIVSVTRNPNLAHYIVYKADNSGYCNRNVTVFHHFFVVTEYHVTAQMDQLNDMYDSLNIVVTLAMRYCTWFEAQRR